MAYANYRFLLIAAVSSVTAAAAPASPQNRSPAEVVMAYVDAANNHDLDAFLALYAPDIRKYQFPATFAASGRDHFKAVYTKSFAQKTEIRVTVVSMLTLGDKVVSRDHVTGLPGGKSADELTVYQVADGLITNITYVDRVEY